MGINILFGEHHHQTEYRESISELEQELLQLVVWNDNVNTFDWVIESLVDICEQNYEQAEQCALIIHNNGKYPVKKGSIEYLKPKATALLDRGIQATVE